MAKKQYTDLNRGRTFTIEYDDTELGSGGVGSVHVILQVDDRPYTTWVIKLFSQSSPALLARLQDLTQFLLTHHLVSDGLSCVPAIVLQDSQGGIAIPMRYAKGPNLESGGGVPREATLPKRLAAAYELSKCIKGFHDREVIIGDLAPDNIIIDPRNWALYLIDIDGCQFSKNGKQYKVIADNSAKGELCPLEHSPHSPYTKEMDQWSLAVLLHLLLTDKYPIGDFGLFRKYASPSKINWPPQNKQTDPSTHLKQLKLLGKPIYDAFLYSFNEGRTEPSARVKADEWEALLEQAQQNMYECHSAPGKPFVALGDTLNRTVSRQK